jgi:hypothetical protein
VCSAKQVMKFHTPQNAGKFLASLKTIGFKENSVRQTYLLISLLKIYCEQININNNLHVRSKKKLRVGKRIEVHVVISIHSMKCQNICAIFEMHRIRWNFMQCTKCQEKASNSSRPLIHKPVGHIQFCYNSKYLNILQCIMQVLSSLRSVMDLKD